MITVITEDDQTFPVDVDASIELENLKALLEVDSNVPAAEQQLLFGGQPLSDDKATLSSLGVQNDDLLVLRDRRRALASRPGPDSGHASAQNLGRPASNANRAAASGPSSSEEQAAEQLRQQLLSDPAALPMLRANNPELADAMQNNPTRFLELLRAQRDRMGGLAGSAAGSGLGDSIDEFDIDAQRRIEEAIRQERVMENLEHAMDQWYRCQGFR
ncbi:hypothetical protein BCV70DRAFT_204151 [Testicularia cyperi]|uniref:Ubiquitin-like domain-containing protein n=1 Tax=Testicularia cyperi TaxID=1882483 RepID=A0A317Y1C7_9BASI|nr:hypothetical protein BCV70DRAFT_204151 [Testicularia cyperi]